MGAKKVVWHVGLDRLLRRNGPSSFEVRSEVPLSDEPPRVDYLLLRKLTADAATDPARTLRRLWPLLPLVSIVEYKSPGRPYRTGNLDRLWGYVHLYFADEQSLAEQRADLCAVLIVPNLTPSLRADIAAMGLVWDDLEDGYWCVNRGLFSLYVVEIDIVGPAEGDDLLHSLGHGQPRSPEARWFWMELVGSKEARMSMQDMEGYEEMLKKFLDTLPPEQRLAGISPELRLAGLAPEQRLAGLPPEQRLAGLAPEQRLAGLPPEQRLAGLAPEQRLAGLAPEQRLAGLDHDHQALALPIDVLRLLPETYLRSLSAEVQAEIRRRLAAD